MGIKQPFEKVVADHGDTVLRVCHVLLASHDADDAWSETFIAAMRAYPDLPETAKGFRLLVQQHLPSIGYGQTRSYRQVAEPVGNPKAVRAVGHPG